MSASLTDIEDGEVARQYNHQGLLAVLPQGLVRAVFIRNIVALRDDTRISNANLKNLLILNEKVKGLNTL